MKNDVKKLIKQALDEDLGQGDITTKATISAKAQARARITAKENGVVAGFVVAAEVFRLVDKRIKFQPQKHDGQRVKKGDVVATLSGPARGILIGERLALNFLQRLSGIATLTAQFVQKVKGTKTLILDTRKTTPLWRPMEKFAVFAGGGVNHRMGLYDGILIKDNHIKLAGGVEKAIVAAKLALPRKTIEVEAATISEVRAAIRAGADKILLDNMNLKTLRQAVKLCKKAKIRTEASGGVNLKTVRPIAKTGVDFISVGSLTHSAKALDLSLNLL